MHRFAIVFSLVILLTGLFSSAQGKARSDPGQPGPFSVSKVSVTVTNPGNGDSLPTDIYFPAVDGQVDPNSAPYAALAFARGFFSSPTYYPGNGTHLASWGYVTAMPDFPSENIENRASDIQYILSYLEAENANPASIFYQRIDVARLGVVGHSLGGLTTMMVAARDARVKVAVALDPVNPPLGTSWNYQLEAPNISAPLAVIGAPSQTCNNCAGYNGIYPLVGSDHKAKWVIAGGSHCDFVDTDNSLQRDACYTVCSIGLVCGGGGSYDAARVQLVEKYTAAWLNYYLQGDTEFFSYLYGPDAQADLDAGLVSREFQTAPRDVSALPQPNAVELRWRLPVYPVIAGYDIYRSTQSGAYPASPSALAGRVSSYLDGNLTAGIPYYYVVRSRDAAGNEHQPSSEVSAVPLVGSTPTATATSTATATPSPTATPTATSPTATSTATPTPTGTASTATPTATYTPWPTAKAYRYWLPMLLAGSSSQPSGEGLGICNEQRGER